MIFIYNYVKKVRYIDSILPKVHNFNSNKDKHFFILGSQHGNEPAPCHTLTEIVESNKIENTKIGMTIVPCVNPEAIKYDVRSLWYYLQNDLNRTWNTDRQKINEFLVEQIDKLKDKKIKKIIVVDFHEAWGFNNCSNGESLGQTIYTNNPQYYDTLEEIIDKINFFNKNQIKENKCKRWKLLRQKEVIDGSLDDFCTKNNLTYILVETAVQNDIVELEERKNTIKYIFDNLVYEHNI